MNRSQQIQQHRQNQHYGDPRVRVRDWNTREPFEIARIFRTIATGALFPYKTTRCFFEPRLPDTAIPLARLKGG